MKHESKPKKFYGRHRDLVESYNVVVSKLISDLMVGIEV